MPTLIATVGSPTANSYQTLAEATSYFDSRLPLPTAWGSLGSTASNRALIMATRVLDSLLQPRSVIRDGYYVTQRQWTGTPATATQKLAWPRIGMYDANGNAIASTDIPSALKEAQAELAGQLLMSDTTLDNAVSVAGITSLSAGSVSLSFKDMIEQHVLPDAVWMLMPASWYTNELRTPANTVGLFEVI